MSSASLQVILTLLLALSQVRGNLLKKQKSFVEDDMDVLLNSWKKIFSNFKELTDTIIKSVLPRFVRFAGEIDIGEDCYESLNKLIFGLVKQELWAFKFLDASAKPAAGYLTGTVSSIGSYDECVDIKFPGSDQSGIQFIGQYCTLDFRLPLPPKPRYVRFVDTVPVFKNITTESEFLQHVLDGAVLSYLMSYRFAICVPSTCTIEDVKNVTKYVADLVGVKSDVPLCETKAIFDPDSTQIAIMAAFSIFGLIIIIFTLVEITPNPWLCRGPAKSFKELSFPARITNAGSLSANVVRLVNVSSPDPRTDCMNGIKFFSMCWVILGHTYLLLNWQIISNNERVKAEIMTTPFQVVLSGFISVDTFFTVTSFLLASITIQLVDKCGKSVFNYGLFILNRLIRLIPMMVAATGFAIVFPLFGSGPIWHETADVVAGNCRKNWWYNLVLYGNFMEPTESCLPYFWYAICDMQLLPVSLIFLVLVFNKPSIGLTFGVTAVGISCVITAVVTYVKDLLPTILFITPSTDDTFDMWRNAHFMPYVHLAPYGVGLIVGYLFARHSDIRINTILQAVFWIVSFVSGFLVTHGTFWWNAGKPWEAVETLLYAGLHRTVWCTCVGWMIFACCTGRGGVINRFLSWNGFVPLGRLTYSAYMIHCLVIWYVVGTSRSVTEGQVFATWIFLGNLSVSFGLAFVCYVFIEAPVNQFFKVIIFQFFGSSKMQKFDEVRVDANGTSLGKSITDKEKEQKDFTKL